MLRKTLLAATLAAGALFAATTGSQAHYYGGGYGGYHNYGYSYRYYQPTYNYYSCRTITFSVWDDYSCSYVYRTKQICG